MYRIGQNILLIYPHFRIDVLQPPRLLNSEDLETVNLDHFLSTEHRSDFQQANNIPSLLGKYSYRNGYLLHLISTCRFKISRTISYSDDHVKVVIFRIRASRILICRLPTKNFDILINTVIEKIYGKTRPTLLVRERYYAFQTIFSSEKQYHTSNILISLLPISRHKERRPIISNVFFFSISLIADGLHHYHPAWGH